MSTNTDHREYIKFVMLGTNPLHFFSGYTNKIGDSIFIEDGKDEKGNIRKKKFEFKEGVLSLHHTKTEWVDFIRNSPKCIGSPNAKGKPMFKEINQAAEAAVRVTNKEDVVNAQHAALQLSGDHLAMVSVMCGYFGHNDSMQKDVCLNYAGTNPAKFLDIVSEKNLQELEHRSFIRKAVKNGTLKTQGNLYTWEGINLGVGEDEVMSKLISDSDLFVSIEEVFKKSGITEVISNSNPIERQANVLARNQIKQ